MKAKHLLKEGLSHIRHFYNDEELKIIDEFLNQEKQKTISNEEIESEATEYANNLNSCWVNDFHGFIDGAIWMQNVKHAGGLAGN